MSRTINDVIFPEIGKTYDVYDDGKVRESRRFQVIPYAIEKLEANPVADLIADYIENDDFYYLGDGKLGNIYKLDVVYCKLVEGDTERIGVEKLAFMLDKNFDWFGIGSFSWEGLLDIDGTLTKNLQKEIEGAKNE